MKSAIEETELDRRAAVLCSHVAVGNSAIRRAVRDDPQMAEDSGWQFHCGRAHDDDPAHAKVWLIHEVIEMEPSLGEFVNYPPGTILVRETAHDSWSVE